MRPTLNIQPGEGESKLLAQTRALTQMWRELDENSKEKYRQMYQKQKEILKNNEFIEQQQHDHHHHHLLLQHHHHHQHDENSVDTTNYMHAGDLELIIPDHIDEMMMEGEPEEADEDEIEDEDQEN